MDDRFNYVLHELKSLRISVEMNGHLYMPESKGTVLHCLTEAIDEMEDEASLRKTLDKTTAWEEQ